MKISAYFDRQYLRRTLTFFFSGVLTVGLVIYIGYHMAGGKSTSLTLVDASYKDVTRLVHADGYILRDETLLYAASATSGSVTPTVTDGTRLALYGKAADIYVNNLPDVTARISEIDRQLSLVEQSKNENMSLVNTSGLESTIFRNIESIRSLAESRNLGDAVTMRSTLLVNIKRRELVKGADYAAQEASLRAEKQTLTAQLGSCLESVYAPLSGYYYADVDGYEAVFTARGIEGLSYEEFMAKTAADPDATARSTVCVGKLATDFRWYLACPVSKKEAAQMEDGGRYDVTFPYNGNKTLSMELYCVIPELPGANAVAVFLSTQIPSGFDYTRMQPVQIHTAEYRGFEIPQSALRILDGWEGVYILDEVTVGFRRVHIAYEGDGYYIVTGEDPAELTEADGDPDAETDTCPYGWIRMNDVVIAEGRGLYVGKVIQGGG